MGLSDNSPASSTGKGIMAVASQSMIMEASLVAGKLLLPLSIPAGNLSSTSEGISSLSLVGGGATIYPVFGDGQGRMEDVGQSCLHRWMVFSSHWTGGVGELRAARVVSWA